MSAFLVIAEGVLEDCAYKPAAATGADGKAKPETTIVRIAFMGGSLLRFLDGDHRKDYMALVGQKVSARVPASVEGFNVKLQRGIEIKPVK